MAESEVRECYADGGVLGRNPSTDGGTWAYLFVDASGKPIREEAGVVTPRQVGLPTITNNMTEMLSCMFAMEALPEKWAGVLHTDSQVTKRRICNAKAAFNGIPNGLKDRFKRAVRRMGVGFRVVLLDGHPNAKQLQSGIVKRGNPCSKFNVRVDKLCQDCAVEFFSMTGENNRCRGKNCDEPDK